jgi:hypothetical protein
VDIAQNCVRIAIDRIAIAGATGRTNVIAVTRIEPESSGTGGRALGIGDILVDWQRRSFVPVVLNIVENATRKGDGCAATGVAA